jgi:hypothetical protein
VRAHASVLLYDNVGELLASSTDTIFVTLRTGMADMSVDNLLPLLLPPAPTAPGTDAVCIVS